MVIAVIFGIIAGLATHGTVHYDECKDKYNFKPNACGTSKVLDDASKIGIKK
jgi:hypothetical protein